MKMIRERKERKGVLRIQTEETELIIRLVNKLEKEFQEKNRLYLLLEGIGEKLLQRQSTGDIAIYHPEIGFIVGTLTKNCIMVFEITHIVKNGDILEF
jgi:hypothetical protein